MNGKLWWTIVTAGIPFVVVLYSRWQQRNKARKRRILQGPEIVVIVGASSGIGREVALQYAARGASLLLVARRKSLLETVQQECQGKAVGFNARVEICTADASVETDAAQISQACREAFGPCTHLVICMGVLSVLTFDELCQLPTPDAPQQDLSTVMKDIFQVNVFGPILIAKHFFPLLQATKGKLVVVSSIAGVFGAPTRSLYASTKFALNGFLDALRIEWTRFGISVINVLPGSVDTGLRSTALDGCKIENDNVKQSGNSKGLSPDHCAQVILKAADDDERQVFVPGYYDWVQLLKFFVPDWVDMKAAKKYGYALE